MIWHIDLKQRSLQLLRILQYVNYLAGNEIYYIRNNSISTSCMELVLKKSHYQLNTWDHRMTEYYDPDRGSCDLGQIGGSSNPVRSGHQIA